MGSQRVSSIIYKKAKQLVDSGAIGKIIVINAWWDRNTFDPIGAFDYSIPPDASPETIDWPRFLGTAPKVPFNNEHFFQWRKWKAYGSGVAGDLFVHLFSGTHFITGSHGPTRAMATGGIRYWKDGRDAPDVLLGLFDYPEGFNLHLRVNFVNGAPENEGFIFTGSEGTLQIGGGVSVTPRAAPNRAGLQHRILGQGHPGRIPRGIQKEISAGPSGGRSAARRGAVCRAAGVQRQLRSLPEFL